MQVLNMAIFKIDAFEHFIALEIRAWISYLHPNKKMYFWRNQSKHEVDFIIDIEIGIEVKATNHIQKKHLNGLFALMEECLTTKHIIVSMDPIPRTEYGIEFLPWNNFLNRLWANQLVLE